MPTRIRKPLAKPWQAKVRIDGHSYYLGYHATREEAAAYEDRFRRENNRLNAASLLLESAIIAYVLNHPDEVRELVQHVQSLAQAVLHADAK